MILGKPKILFLSSWYPNRTKPSFGIFVQRHAQAVAQENNVALLYACADEKMKENTFEIITLHNNNIHEVLVYYKKVSKNIPFFSTLIKLYRYLKAYIKGYRYIQNYYKGNPDLLHVNIVFPIGIIALLLNYIYAIPLVISEHWSGYSKEDNSYTGTFMKWISSRTVKKARAVMVVSEKMKSQMLAHNLKNNYSIIPNVVDTDLFFPVTSTKQMPVKIIHVSSVNDREKNISGILRTIQELSKQRKNFVLEIVGESNEKGDFEAYAQKLGILNEFVFFRGFKSPEELSVLLRNSAFFLMFSNYEGLPCVLIEALASGIPVISSNVGGIPDIISREQGLLVKPGNEKELLEAILVMMDSYFNFDKLALKTYAEKNFSFGKVAKEINEVYNSAIINQKYLS